MLTTSIKLWYNDGDLLTDTDKETYSLDLSCAEYERLLLAKLTKHYPYADIKVIRNRDMTGYCRPAEYDGASDTYDAADLVSLDSEVYETWAWTVEK